jgi:hypothetical protein
MKRGSGDEVHTRSSQSFQTARTSSNGIRPDEKSVLKGTLVYFVDTALNPVQSSVEIFDNRNSIEVYTSDNKASFTSYRE